MSVPGSQGCKTSQDPTLMLIIGTAAARAATPIMSMRVCWTLASLASRANYEQGVPAFLVRKCEFKQMCHLQSVMCMRIGCLADGEAAEQSQTWTRVVQAVPEDDNESKANMLSICAGCTMQIPAGECEVDLVAILSARCRVVNDFSSAHRAWCHDIPEVPQQGLRMIGLYPSAHDATRFSIFHPSHLNLPGAAHAPTRCVDSFVVCLFSNQDTSIMLSGWAWKLSQICTDQSQASRRAEANGT